MAKVHLTKDQLDNRRKAFDLVDDWAKLLATLATGTLVLSATFIKDLLPKDAHVEARGLLYIAWAILGLSAVFGVVVLQALIAHLNRADANGELDVYAGSIRLTSLLQFSSFVVGIALFATFVAVNL